MEVLPEGVSAPIRKGPGLYEFLVEAELQQYFNSLKNNLKVTHPSQLKFATDGDLAELGMSKPEMRRLRKYYEKHFPNNYLLKFKKLLTAKKHEPVGPEPEYPSNNDTLPIQRAPRVPSKHIIPAANITVNKELGMGEFGVVQQGVWCNEGERIQVAIKCLARERMQTNTIEFLKEAAIMHSIDHHHIVRLFGVVLDTGSLMLVTELAPLRSLLECLKEPSLRSSFPVLTLCDFAVQICDGMQYLEAKRLIHRDLAARNILVFSKNKVKISDFGLSRALGQGKDYYQTNFNVNLKLPIAWCAPECISYLRFTTASDVWAFGVTLWEMFSYGFQPWAALTGQQILEAIDEPNFQRLEQPDCCPQDHYALMLDCWRHEAATRPRFSDIATRLVDCRPEQVQAKSASSEGPHLLPFRVGDVLTVLDKVSHRPLWKGVSASGKTGVFDPGNVVAYLGSDLPSSSFMRSDSTRTSSRRKLRSEMISAPQGDLKHTGHVGLDGAYFGDLSFLSGAKVDYGGIPTQVVAPYRPHKDLEAAPLLEGDHVPLPPAPSNDHEYHEISDEETTNSPNLDLGPSLMAEMEMMFNNLGQPPPSPADHEGSNKSNELREQQRLAKPRKQATVKPISAHDQKTLDTVIAMANEISTRSMSAPAPTTPSSPNKRKFNFRFPPVSEFDKHPPVERRNFSEEAHSTPDLQSKVTHEAQMAYKSLVENATPDMSQLMQVNNNPLRMLRSGQIPVIKPRLRTATLPAALSRGHDRKFNPDSLESHKSDMDLTKHRDVHRSSSEFNNHQQFRSNENVENERPDNNPALPVPPRDKKPALTSKPRHTRKHPLIIPPTSFQATLDKFTLPPTPPTATIDPFQLPMDHTYKNRNPKEVEREFDNESVHFEAQIDSELAALDEIAQDQDCVDSAVDELGCLSVQEMSNRKMNFQDMNFRDMNLQDMNLRDINHRDINHRDINNQNMNLGDIVHDINHRDVNHRDTSQRHMNRRDVGHRDMTHTDMSHRNMSHREMSHRDVSHRDVSHRDMSLREMALKDMTFKDTNSMVQTHHVSCEDLLEFANTKPSSRARGYDSDEVRLMLKVLGKDVPTEQCLQILEFTNWDVLTAIKIANLKKIVIGAELATCKSALEATSWDTTKAAQLILQEDEVMQV